MNIYAYIGIALIFCALIAIVISLKGLGDDDTDDFDDALT